MLPRRQTTLSDVAKAASVDRSVVSRVLNGDPRLSIRDETRQRVLEAIRSTGYVPNVLARSLRTSRSGTLGLFIPDFSNPVFAEVISGAEAAAVDRGYALLAGSSSSAGRGESFIKLLGQGRVDGLVLAGEVARANELAALAVAGIPHLFLNRRMSGSSRSLILDDGRAAAMAVQHLAALGHKRIAHLGGPSAADTAKRRRGGYLEAMQEARLDADPGLSVASPYTSEGGYEGMRALLRGPEYPTAVVVANFVAAVGALTAVHDAGLRVPRDLSVVAIHDSTMAGYTSPALTTVRMPLRDLGRRGVELLLTTAADEQIEETLHGSIELVPRASTAPPPRESASQGRQS